MSRILIAAKVPRDTKWLSCGDYVFKQVAKRVKRGLTEDLGSRNYLGDWGDCSTIDDFVILGTTLERAENFRGIDSEKGMMMDHFSYRMDDDRNLFSEDRVVLVETYGKNRGYSDFVKWRVRNIMGKLVDDAGHPNGFILEVQLYQAYDGKTILPRSGNEIFYLAGSRDFKRDYLRAVPKEFRAQRITRL